MKSLIVTALLVSFNAFSCPDLSGSFLQCRSLNGVLSNQREAVYSQAEVDGVTSYIFESVDEETSRKKTQKVRADGKAISQMDRKGVTETTRTYCEGNALIQEIVFSKSGLILGTGQKVMARVGNTVLTTIVGKLGGELINDQLACE